MESNQDQALMRGPPDHRANGPDIPLSGYVVSFSALLTCLSPRNSVRTCALARVEGSVPPTSGFGIRRSPLSYTRILFERVRICTSHRATSWVPTSLACSGSSLSLEASTLARPAQGAFMGLTTRRRVSIPPPLNGATARLVRRGEA